MCFNYVVIKSLNFMDELELVNCIEKIYSKKGYITLKEISAGYGRADLVLGKLDNSNCLLRQKHNQKKPLLKERFFEVLRNIPDINSAHKPISIKELNKKINFSKTYLKKNILSYLEENGYILKVENKYFYKIDGWVPIANEVIAIEAKLSAWKKGVLQANRYKSFADKVYLALPEKKAHLVNISLLSELNIGLIVLSENRKKIYELYNPITISKSLPDKRNFVSEILWNTKSQNLDFDFGMI